MVLAIDAGEVMPDASIGTALRVMPEPPFTARQSPPQPTLAYASRVIAANCNTTERHAEGMLHWLHSHGDQILNSSRTSFVGLVDLIRYHSLLKRVIPDDATSTPGSVHELCEQYVSAQLGTSIVLRHSKTARFNPTLSWCIVTVNVHRVL